MAKCLITVEGGVGKNVMLTAILPMVKEKYDEIYIASPYWEIFKCCPYVEDAFPFDNSNLYQELCLEADCTVLWREPYSHPKFIKKECHLFEAWLDELFIANAKTEADLMLLTPQIDVAKEYPELVEQANKLKEEYNHKYIIVQFCGGQSPFNIRPIDKEGHIPAYNDHQEPLKRNYFKGQQLVNLLKKEYPEYTIIHYALKNEPSYENTVKLEVPFLLYRELAKDAFKIVCTDSSLQHLVSGAAKDVTVIWGETQPQHFGYSCNKNIISKNVKNTQPYFRPLGSSPALIKFPSPEEVMEEVKKEVRNGTENRKGRNKTE